ncbi:kinase-like domain-containing protein, partial [Globomyces pollinis-pini]
IASLWAGYGTIYRVLLSNGESVIVKLVQPTRNDSGISHQRKLKSYQVESYFYSHLAFDRFDCRMPKHLYSYNNGQNMCLIMDDLEPTYPSQKHDLDCTDIKSALTWLAKFHCHFWNKSPEGVWSNGGYWYLDTRLEEWESISKKYGLLKENARAIDLKTRDRRFETLIHGDPKSENILWDNQANCSFYDFQYVGVGLGAKDVAYLVTSSANHQVLQNDDFLKDYFDALVAESIRTNTDLNGYTFELFCEHFNWCLLDYFRFMAGWGLWGNHRWCFQRIKHLI